MYFHFPDICPVFEDLFCSMYFWHQLIFLNNVRVGEVCLVPVVSSRKGNNVCSVRSSDMLPNFDQRARKKIKWHTVGSLIFCLNKLKH